jgi:CRP-like cAMP-binding protein
MRDLLKFIRTFSAISDEAWSTLSSIVTEREFKKGEHLVHPYEQCNSLFFISKGYCRAYQIQDGTEVNLNFFFEKEIATSINSYLKNQRTTFAIQACEPLIAYEFNKMEVAKISKRVPEIGAIGKQSLEMIAARQERQLELYRLLKTKDRYEYLEKNQPEILQRVTLTHLSSYLGVARETLSRIRRKKTP